MNTTAERMDWESMSVVNMRVFSMDQVAVAIPREPSSARSPSSLILARGDRAKSFSTTLVRDWRRFSVRPIASHPCTRRDSTSTVRESAVNLAREAMDPMYVDAEIVWIC